MYNLIKQDALAKYDPKRSAYTTYISKVLHNSISTYQTYQRIGKGITDHNHGCIDRHIDINQLEDTGMDSEDIADIEAKYDIYKFFSWYKTKRLHNAWRTDTDISILKYRMMGLSQTEIAAKLGVTPQAIYFSSRKIRTLYRAWLKEITLKDRRDPV